MSATDVSARADHARGYLLVAELIADDTSIAGRANLAAAIAVLCGIAASDAICGHSIHERSASDSHAEAVALLKGATPADSTAAKHLKRLVDEKTDAQYSPALMTESRMHALVTAAARLVDEMERLLAR